MKILITGGGGFLGFRLAKTLLARGTLGGKPISGVTLLDGAFPPDAANLPKVKAVTGDVSEEKTIAGVCGPDTEAVFHLAADGSGAGEADFHIGRRDTPRGAEILHAPRPKCGEEGSSPPPPGH